jgi:hypothetical protein
MSAPNPQQATNDANSELFRLYLQTGDLSIYNYIQHGWTTPVSAAVQPRVQAIIRRYSNPAAVVPVVSPGQSPIPGAPGAPPDQSPLATLPTGPAATPLPASSVWPDQPPGAGANNPAPNALPIGGKGGSFFNSPAPAGGGYNSPSRPPGPTGDYGNEITPGSIGLGGPPSPTVAAGQRAGAAATQAGGARPGGGSTVSASGPGFSPAGGNPLTNPAGGGGATGAFGAIDPTSAIGQQGYTQAQAGDPTALSAVLTSILGKFGIDVNRGGIFTPGLVSSLAPYLKTVMEYGGLANGGKPVIPSQLADQFGGMVGGANTFGQIQDFARNLLPTAQGLLGAPAGALADSGNQIGMVNDLLGMLTAGANPLYQQYQQGVNKKTLSDYVQSQLGGPTQNYIDWMRANAAKTPGSDLLAQIIGASR